MALAFFSFLQQHIGKGLKYPFSAAVNSVTVADIQDEAFYLQALVTVPGPVSYIVTIKQFCCFDDPDTPYRTEINYSWKKKSATFNYGYEETTGRWVLKYTSHKGDECSSPDLAIFGDDWEAAYQAAGLPLSETSIVFVPEDNVCKKNPLSPCSEPGFYAEFSVFGLIDVPPVRIFDWNHECPSELVFDISGEIIGIVVSAVADKYKVPVGVDWDSELNKFVISLYEVPLLEATIRCCPGEEPVPPPPAPYGGVGSGNTELDDPPPPEGFVAYSCGDSYLCGVGETPEDVPTEDVPPPVFPGPCCNEVYTIKGTLTVTLSDGTTATETLNTNGFQGGAFVGFDTDRNPSYSQLLGVFQLCDGSRYNVGSSRFYEPAAQYAPDFYVEPFFGREAAGTCVAAANPCTTGRWYITLRFTPKRGLFFLPSYDTTNGYPGPAPPGQPFLRLEDTDVGPYYMIEWPDGSAVPAGYPYRSVTLYYNISIAKAVFECV